MVDVTFPINIYTPGQKGVNISILKRSVSQSAPEVLVLEASPQDFTLPVSTVGSLYDPTLHDVDYMWRVTSGVSGVEFSSPSGKVQRSLSADKGWGKRFAFFAPTAGSYTIEVRAFNRTQNEWATNTITFTVLDKVTDLGWGELTVGPAGDYTSINALMAAVTTNSVVTVDRGHVETGNGVWYRDQGSLMFKAASGAGSLPKISYQFNKDGVDTSGGGVFIDPRVSGKELTFYEIDFEGYYDSTTDFFKGSLFPDGQGIMDGIRFSADSILDTFLCYKCKFSGLQTPIRQQGNGGDYLFSMVDCEVLDWQEYGAYLEGPYMNILGCRFETSSDSTNALGRTNGQDKKHGALRQPDSSNTILDRTVFRAAQGWFINTSPTAYATGQAVVRLNQSSIEDAVVIVTGCVLTGGNQIIDCTPTNAGDTIRQQNLLFEGNIFEADHMSASAILLPTGGATFANNLFCFPDTPRIGSVANPDAVVLLYDHPATSYVASDSFVRTNPVKIVNNTILNKEATLTGLTVWSKDTVFTTDPTEANNILDDTGSSPAGVLDTTILFAPLCDGYYAPQARDGLTVVSPKDTSFASPANTVTSGKLPSGSPAEDAATNSPRYDLEGVVRNTEDNGAWRAGA